MPAVCAPGVFSGLMKLCRLKPAFCILALLLPIPAAHAGPAEAPQYTMSSWTARDGLPSSYILSLTQDRDGYLWVGTNAGLVRFDGKRFVTWPGNRQMPSLSPVIFSVSAAREGGVWIAFGGLSQIVRDHGGQMDVFTAKAGLPEGGMRAVVERRDGSVWAGGVNGLARLHGARWDHVAAPFGGTLGPVIALSEDRA